MQEPAYVGSRISQLLAGPGLNQTSAYKPQTESSTYNLNATQTISYQDTNLVEQVKYPHTELLNARQKIEKLENEIKENS